MIPLPSFNPLRRGESLTVTIGVYDATKHHRAGDILAICCLVRSSPLLLQLFLIYTRRTEDHLGSPRIQTREHMSGMRRFTQKVTSFYATFSQGRISCVARCFTKFRILMTQRLGEWLYSSLSIIPSRKSYRRTAIYYCIDSELPTITLVPVWRRAATSPRSSHRSQIPCYKCIHPSRHFSESVSVYHYQAPTESPLMEYSQYSRVNSTIWTPRTSRSRRCLRNGRHGSLGSRDLDTTNMPDHG